MKRDLVLDRELPLRSLLLKMPSNHICRDSVRSSATVGVDAGGLQITVTKAPLHRRQRHTKIRKHRPVIVPEIVEMNTRDTGASTDASKGRRHGIWVPPALARHVVAEHERIT